MHLRVRFDKAVEISTGHFRRELHLDIERVEGDDYEVNMRDNHGGRISFNMTCKDDSTIGLVTKSMNHIKGMA